MIDWADYPNFSRREFVCRCGCGQASMDADFVQALQNIRDAVGFAMPITSGFRCPDYNNRISPQTGLDGPHTTGLAADIGAYGAEALDLVFAAEKAGMTGIGVRQKGALERRFIHLDQHSHHIRPWIWSY